jgi:CheY-like chemotaxis protein
MSSTPDSRRSQLPRELPLVLIADGHDDTRELYEFALPSYGFRTIVVEDGTQVVERASESKPDIIVTEIYLPQHDGWSVVEQLKRDARTRDIPVVVLTGYTAASVRERASSEGCAALLMKPYLPEELARALRELLNGAA